MCAFGSMALRSACATALADAAVLALTSTALLFLRSAFWDGNASKATRFLKESQGNWMT
jgi:hypothetical protein